MSRSIKERLEEWKDTDLALWEIGTVLGILPEFSINGFGDLKHLIWSRNNTSTMLNTMLNTMITHKVLARDQEDGADRVRWCALTPTYTK